MKSKIKTIDVNAYEWFDKVNGNSYFAGTVTVNYGMKSEKEFAMPFQYGYGSSYEDEAKRVLLRNGVLPENEDTKLYALSRYCRDNKIIYRHTKHENCLLRDLRRIGG